MNNNELIVNKVDTNTSLLKKEQLELQALQEFGMTKNQLDLIRDVYCKGCTNEEIRMFLHICHRTGLDPVAKQIYPVKRHDTKLGRDVMTIQTGIDGYRLIAERTEKYAPGKEYEHKFDANGKLFSSTAYIKKMTKDGTWHEVSASAIYSEYVQLNKNGMPTSFWFKMPCNQLGKCAEALALRKAFPMEMSGVYTSEEMQQSKIEVEDIQESADVAIVDNVQQYEPIAAVSTDNLTINTHISKEQLDFLLTQYEGTDDTFKEKFREVILRDWHAHELWQIPAIHYDTCMQGIANNLKKKKAANASS